MSLGTLKRIPFKEPTKEELRASSLRWLERCGHTLLDNWPKEYRDLSMTTHLIEFNATEMADHFWGDESFPNEYGNELARQIDAVTGWSYKFIRLNSRSPKDNCWPCNAPIALSGKEAVNMIAGSERCLDDVCRFKYVPEQPAYICLRDIERGLRPDREFRCFIKDRKLIAVTAYDYTDESKDLDKFNTQGFRAKIDTFIAEKIIPSLPSDDLVVDIWLGRDDFGLVEINPYGLSDPCFFFSYENVENSNSYVQTTDPRIAKEG